MRHPTATLAVSVALSAALLSGCGGGDGDEGSRTNGGAGSGSVSAPGQIGALPKRAKPRPASSFRGQDRINYVNSRGYCRSVGAEMIGQIYEADNPGRAEAARAYAAQRFGQDRRQAAYEGCLAGLVR